MIRRFAEISAHDLPKVGGKGANLGVLTRAGFPVPPVLHHDGRICSLCGRMCRTPDAVCRSGCAASR